MHTTSDKIRKQMGLWYADVAWEDALQFEMMQGEQVKKGDPIFPRLDIDKELEELEAMKGGSEEENIPLELKPEIEYDVSTRLISEWERYCRQKSTLRQISCWYSR